MSKSKKYFYRRLNIQLCELLEAVTETAIEEVLWEIGVPGILDHNK